jgi:hypothetical protein
MTPTLLKLPHVAAVASDFGAARGLLGFVLNWVACNETTFR